MSRTAHRALGPRGPAFVFIINNKTLVVFFPEHWEKNKYFHIWKRNPFSLVLQWHTLQGGSGNPPALRSPNLVICGLKKQLKVCPPSPYIVTSCDKGCRRLLLHLTIQRNSKMFGSAWTLVTAAVKGNKNHETSREPMNSSAQLLSGEFYIKYQYYK